MKTIPWCEGSDLEGTSIAQIWEWDTDENTIHVSAVSSAPHLRKLLISQNEGFVGTWEPLPGLSWKSCDNNLIHNLLPKLHFIFVLGNDQLTMTFLSIFTLRGIYVLVVLINSGNWQLGTGREVKVFLALLKDVHFVLVTQLGDATGWCCGFGNIVAHDLCVCLLGCQSFN